MKTLNCKRTAGMISLYVAGDLTGASEREVSAHLAACAGCRQLAAEFSESNSLLVQACPTPEFEAEFYSGIRTAVLGEIKRSQRPARPWFFQRSWVYATSFAAAVIAFLLLLQHFGSNRHQRPDNVAVIPTVSGEPTPGHVQDTNPLTTPQSPKSPQLSRGSDELVTMQERQPTPLFVHRRRSPRQFEAAKTPGANATAESALATGLRIKPMMESSASGDPNTAESRAASGLATASLATPMSRIEIQTADPNIRIIWLTPSESKESEGANQDQDQHGKRK